MSTHPPVAPPAPPVAQPKTRFVRSWWSRATASGQGFPTLIAGLIALTSILAAVAAWRAADISESANRDDLTAIQQYGEREQERSVLRSRVAEDVRNLVLYQQHFRSAQLLSANADAIRASQPLEARALDLEAQAELTLSRQQLFHVPDALSGQSTVNVPVQYDRQRALEILTARDRALLRYTPETILRRAERLHGMSLGFLLLVILFVAALAFLTVAQFGRRATRTVFAGAGSALTVGTGIALLVLWMASG